MGRGSQELGGKYCGTHAKSDKHKSRSDTEMRHFTNSRKAIITSRVMAFLLDLSFEKFRWANIPKDPTEIEHSCDQLDAE